MVDLKKYWVGSTGPFTYDADVALPDRGTNLPAGVTNQSTLITTGQLNVATAPTDATHVLREEDIGGIVGDVSGPAGATDNAVARFDGVTGKLLDDCGVLINDSDVVMVPSLTASQFVGTNGSQELVSVSIGFGAAVTKTIASGAIALTVGQSHVQLTGEGNVADTLTGITGASEGDVIVLRGKTGLAYNITVSDAGTLKLQANFTIDSEYDTLSLLNIGSDNWVEISRSSNA